MKSALLMLTFLSAQALVADQLYCSQPGYRVTVQGGGDCTLTGPAIDPSQPTSPFGYSAGGSGSFYGGNFYAHYQAVDTSDPRNVNFDSFPMSATFTANDFYSLPVSKPSDVLAITMDGVGVSSILVSVGPSPDLGFGTGYDFHVGSNYCTITRTVPAANINFVSISGSKTWSIDGNGYIYDPDNTDVFIDFELQRFLADGVTPDPFTPTPEPSAIALFAIGALILPVRALKTALAR